MIITEDDYLDHIQQTFPSIRLDDVMINQDGMVNVSVIVNRERVFRFPRADWGIPLLHQEMRVLDLIRPHIDMQIPNFDYRSDEMVSYPYITGEPLLTDDVERMPEKDKDLVAEILGRFLKQLHSIPLAKVKAADVTGSETIRSVEDWLQFYNEVQEHLFPLMWADGREWVKRHFSPVVANGKFLEYERLFMHGDLATYHLLFDRPTNRFNGIIDFGTAGIGDPAADFGCIINQYGESFLRRMSGAYPEISDHIQRARFWAGTLELQWILGGIKRNDPSMFVVHIGRARNMRPIDAAW